MNESERCYIIVTICIIWEITVCMLFWLDILVWFSTILLIICSVIRAFRVGYDTELYAASACFYVPIIVGSIFDHQLQIFLRNMAYLIIAMIGTHRWATNS